MVKTAAVLMLTTLATLGSHSHAYAQSAPPALPSLSAFPLNTTQGGLSISADAVPSRPFSVVGPRGAVLGQQDGSYELWLFPWKILNKMHIDVAMQDYDVPIDVNAHASSIEVRPEATTITFSHANFTVKEVMIAPKKVPDGAGALVFYQIQAIRPMTLTFSFNPVMQRMWPAESDDRPSPEWVKTAGGSGFYILHLNFPDNAAAIAMPTAEPGILEPYQELAHDYPLQFVIHFDPARDSHTWFPLLLTMGTTAATATKEALAKQLTELDQNFATIYEQNAVYYRDFQSTHMKIDTPDERLNQAFSWAEVSIDQLRVETTPNHDEEALTAGFVGSGDAARPGFGWFFGRDALWSLYAINSYGDFDTTKRELQFLIRRQSPEGKIPHEWSQTANLVDWKILPYEYASSDATPLFEMAMNDYLKISGDTAFVSANWTALALAWNFECTHDSNGDGIYDNSEGSGWVESWLPSMPRQEVYLAALDEQASLAFSNLAKATGHSDLAKSASDRAARIRGLIEKEYYLPQSDFYAFSWNGPGNVDQTATVFPSVAWWDGNYSLDHSHAMTQRWASSEFSTDWGTRIASDKWNYYDPIAYHQGTVWPLFTGWISVAEYRTGQSLSAWTHLQQNANLTWSQDLGSTTELLSGQFFQPLGRSTAHQLWSSAMVVSPVVRGLFGLEWDVSNHTLSVNPSLPATWDHATLSDIPFGTQRLNLSIKRDGDALIVRPTGAMSVRLMSHISGSQTTQNTLRIPLPAVEAGVDEKLPESGSITDQMKVLDQTSSTNSLTLHLVAPAGTMQAIYLRINRQKLLSSDSLHAAGTQLPSDRTPLMKLNVDFPDDTAHDHAYVGKDIIFQW